MMVTTNYPCKCGKAILFSGCGGKWSPEDGMEHTATWCGKLPRPEIEEGRETSGGRRMPAPKPKEDGDAEFRQLEALRDSVFRMARRARRRR